MHIEIPLFVLKLGGLLKPRWLVYQYEIRGVANAPMCVYAKVFYTRKAAKKAEAEADSTAREDRQQDTGQALVVAGARAAGR